MDKIIKAIDELKQLCEEENVNLVAAATKSGNEGPLKQVLYGELQELIVLMEYIEDNISEQVGLPYGLIKFEFLLNCGKEDE